MVRTPLLILLALGIAVLGGAGSVKYVLDNWRGLGAVELGAWTTYPDLGSPGADPYSRALASRERLLTLGPAEGISFEARRDRDGQPLRRDCSYLVDGTMPQARFWTLYAGDGSRRPLPVRDGLMPGVHSRQVLRRPDNSVAVAVSRHAAAGNWLPVEGDGPLTLILSLYDTPAANRSGIGTLNLPQIRRTGCEG